MSTASDAEPARRSPEDLVETFLTALLEGDGAAMADVVTDHCVYHQPRWPRTTEGLPAIVAEAESNLGTFADVSITVDQSVVDVDRIAAQVTASGRNVGAIRMEDREIAPTGRSFEVPQFGIYRIEDGRIAEVWVLADALGLIEQLDNLPAGPAAMVRIMLRQLRWRLGGRRSLE